MIKKIISSPTFLRLSFILLVVYLLLSSISCSNEKPTGSNPIYAIHKGYRTQEHVVTIHGFQSNKTVCYKFIDMLNIEEPNSYHCLVIH